MPGRQRQRIQAPQSPRDRAKDLRAKATRTPQENVELTNLLADIVLDQRGRP